MSKAILLSSLLFLSANLAFAGGGPVPRPVPPKQCNSGIDGNHDCRGDSSGNVTQQPPIVIPRNGNCPATVVTHVETPSFTVDLTAVADSIHDAGIGPKYCAYKAASLRTSIGKVTQVGTVILDGVGAAAPTFVSFVVDQRKFNLSAKNSGAALFEVKDFANPYDTLLIEDAIPQNSTYEVSEEYVTVKNSLFKR